MNRKARICLTGAAYVVHTDGTQVPLARRTAALLAYLALKGSMRRSRIAALLWPDAIEPTARANLRQLLRRLRVEVGEACVVGGDLLQLAPAASLDVRDKAPEDLSGELLAGHLYDDCEELAAWVTGQRERLNQARSTWLRREIDRLEREGSVSLALELARDLTRLDPLSEESHRLVMRLCHVAGDRPAALKAFRDCEAVLWAELGVRPSPETLRLAADIERSVRAADAAERQSARPRVPLAVARPPALAGREEAWRILEAAFEARQTIFIGGEAGVGKSRLASDFAASRGRWVHLEARPADHRVPFSTHARSARTLLAASPGLSLPRRVRRELGRLVPGLDGASRPPPARDDEARPLFMSAIAEFFWAATRELAVIVLDDAHYIDPESAELSLYLHMNRPDHLHRSVVINSFRTGEPGELAQAGVNALVEAGTGRLIELKPLAAGDVHRMVESMEAGLESISAELARYTGGNPLFVVETAKHLLESGGFDGTFPSTLPPPGRIRPIVQRRLARLSPEALALARLVAIAQTDFSLASAARVLGRPPAQLVDPWSELERAHILRGEWFTHDVLAEVVLEGIPPAIRTALSEMVAGSGSGS